jgi:hypothetical protein
MTEPAVRPDPRDFDDIQSYEKAMTAYLDDLQADTGEASPLDVIRNWRENPPADGWE